MGRTDEIEIAVMKGYHAMNQEEDKTNCPFYWQEKDIGKAKKRMDRASKGELQEALRIHEISLIMTCR